VSDPYEAPENPDLIIDTGTKTLEQCMSQVLDLMKGSGMLIDLYIKQIVQSLVQPMSIEEKAMIDNKMEVL